MVEKGRSKKKMFSFMFFLYLLNHGGLMSEIEGKKIFLGINSQTFWSQLFLLFYKTKVNCELWCGLLAVASPVLLVAEGSPAGPKWCAGLNKSTICVVSCRAVRDLRLSFVTINRYNFLEHQIWTPVTQFPFQFLWGPNDVLKKFTLLIVFFPGNRNEITKS